MRTSHVAASRFRGGRTTLGIAEGAGLDRFDDADAVHRHFAYDTALGPDSRRGRRGDRYPHDEHREADRSVLHADPDQRKR
jgi:hypothetical protein